MKKIINNISLAKSPKEIKEKEGSNKKVNFQLDNFKELNSQICQQKQMDPKALDFESVFDISSMIDKVINRSSSLIYLEKLEKKLFPFSLLITLDQTFRIWYINFLNHDLSENNYLDTKLSQSFEPSHQVFDPCSSGILKSDVREIPIITGKNLEKSYGKATSKLSYERSIENAKKYLLDESQKAITRNNAQPLKYVNSFEEKDIQFQKLRSKVINEFEIRQMEKLKEKAKLEEIKKVLESKKKNLEKMKNHEYTIDDSNQVIFIKGLAPDSLPNIKSNCNFEIGKVENLGDHSKKIASELKLSQSLFQLKN